MAYCMYLRKSRRDLELEHTTGEDTLARHHSILTDLAQRNHHLIGQIYREVVSGADAIQDRPQCQQMLNDMIAGKWEGVYVAAIDRLARGDTADQGTIQRVFMVTGALIITPERVYNPRGNAMDEQSVEFSLFLARQEYKISTQRQQAGRERSTDEGKFVGTHAAYGYRKYKLPDQRGFSLMIHEEEARVVYQIGSWYLYGMDGEPMGLTAIASRLTDIGIPPGQNAKRWTASRIYNMLRNPVYAGWIRYGYEKIEKDLSLTGYTKRRVINNDCKLRKGMHQAIWPQEMFDAIQNKLHGYQKHLPVRKGAPLANPLAGLVVCGWCGHVMSHLPDCGRQPAILKCRTRGCPTVQNYRAPVEEAVLSALRSWLDDPGQLAAPAAQQQTADLISAMESMQSERTKLLGQVDRIQDLLEQGEYSLETYRARYSKLRTRLEELEKAVAEEQAKLDARPVYATPQELRPAILHLLEAYPTATPQEKNDMLKSCISSVRYFKEKRGVIIKGHVYSDPAEFFIDVFPLIKK